ncbi:MAG: ZIP family metal transporter [archaeon]
MAIPVIVQILLAVFIVSAISFVGAFTLFMQKSLHQLINYLVAFAVGGMLGAAFLDLLPEAVEKTPNWGIYVLAGILAFFLIELYFHWHHHHTHIKAGHKHIHPVGYLNLIGDGAHNFLDGMIIAASFIVNPALGIITTVAVIMHEIPQEFGDFGILIHAGFTKGKALFFNFLSALTAITGAMVAFFAVEAIRNISIYIVPFAAGGFIYMATADLLPEIHKHQGEDFFETILQTVLIFLGVSLIWLISIYFGA